jgi:hypothetical protein
MKQEMRRTRKASEVRPALDEMADFNGQAGVRLHCFLLQRKQNMGQRGEPPGIILKAPCHCGDSTSRHC